VAIGPAGIGKTCLCCRLAESLEAQNPNSLPLLISAESVRLIDRDGDELKTALSERIRSAVPAMTDEYEFEAFCRFLKANGLHLVVFIDGLNELQGNDSYSSFNKQFDQLVELVHHEDLPVHFSLTCRYEWWRYFSTSRWAVQDIYSKLMSEQATVLLEPPSTKEVQQLSERYFDYFAINGQLSGEAITTCQNLLMLRLLCDAYTNRPINNKDPKSSNIKPYDLKVISSLKKKEILKRYVASRREAFVEFVRNALSESGVIDTTPSNIYFLTTFYIINIANFMYQKRRASVTADEVFAIAEAIHHPDATLGKENISSSSKSFFLRLIDLGIFSRNEKDAREFSFVYETYFEFSLGRYIAFVRWHDRTGGTFAHGPIEADLEYLISEHAQQSRDGDFSNLFGAIQFAVLATEAGDWINWAQLPAEEGVYKKHPRLFGQLVSRLADTDEGFDWLQQACAIIRETELAKIETWKHLETQNGDRTKAREQFGELLEVLDKLATTTDFVLLWDIENTLKTLAQANLGLTLDQLKRWAESGDSLKIVFAAQVVSALARDNSERVLTLLLDWIRNQKFRSNFWIIRSLLFAISEFTRANYQSNLENNSDWLQLRSEVFKLLDSDLPLEMSSYIRSRALSLLPNLSLSQGAELNRIDGFIEERLNEHDSWQLLNLVFNLTNLPNVNHRAEEWIFKTLNHIATHRNHHLWYAIEKVLDSIEGSKELSPEISRLKAEIEQKYDGRRWKTNGEPKIHKLTNQLGIVYTPRYLEPDYENHPECRERLVAIINKLEQCGEENFVWITPREADPKELRKVHNVETDRHRDRSPWGNYIETIAEASRTLSANEQVERTGASELRFESFETAKMAAGGVIKGIDYVLESDALAAFVLNRPPGHLANNTICIFNNIAVGAFHALRKMKRILIVDCDAHHGKHTQKVFYRSPNVLYFSMHIDGDYAREDGMITNIGEGPGKGYTFNIPYPPNMGDEGYEFISNNLLLPVALDFKPELILVSAGFDGHFDDPLTPVCRLSEQSYINLARILRQIAELNHCKIVGALEGGYALTAMPNSLAHMLNIWGDWNLEREIGYTPKPANYSETLNLAAVDAVRELVAQRIKLMKE
jgi:acetoin utilization deacetylase AcuC-like enzyme